MRAAVRALGALAALLGAAGWSPPARAHGGIPRLVGIAFAPDDPSTIVVKADAWGFFRTTDGGETWWWNCAESYRGDSLGVLHPSVVVTPEGTVLIANFYEGLQRSDPAACGWDEPAELEGLVVDDVRRSAGGALYAVTSVAGVGDGRLWRSDDEGRSFAEVGPIAPDMVPVSVAVAPDAPERIYVTGIGRDSARVLATSDDGGATFQVASLPESDDPSVLPVIAGVTSGAPDEVFVRFDAQPASQNDLDPADRLLVTSDGGASFRVVFSGTQDVPGFAFSPDGERVAVAGPGDGLHIASLAAVREAGAAAFEPVFTGKLWALAWTERGLYAGYDDFAEPEKQRFSFGLSTDDGRTFTPLMEICDVLLNECPDGTRTQSECADVFQRAGGFDNAILQSSRCVHPLPEVDAGSEDPPDDPRAENGGCGCSLAPASPPPGPLAWGSAVLAAFSARLRSRRRRYGAVQR